MRTRALGCCKRLVDVNGVSFLRWTKQEYACVRHVQAMFYDVLCARYHAWFVEGR